MGQQGERPPGSQGSPVAAQGWRAAFPPATWLTGYRSAWLAKDAVAGITLAAYGIPVSLAYASLAGLPPQYGIYCYLIAGLLRAVRHVAAAGDRTHVCDFDAGRRNCRRHGGG